MSKYDQIPLRKIKARVEHICLKCNKLIKIGDVYYAQKDRFLHSLSNKKFCKNCYSKFGENLLKEKHTRENVPNQSSLEIWTKYNPNIKSS